MKFKIKLAIISIYLLAFSNIIFSVSGNKEFFTSLLLLGVDLVILYLGIPFITKSKLNISLFFSIIIISLLNFLAHDYSLLTLVNGLREIWLIILIFSFYENIPNAYQELLNKYLRRFVLLFLLAQMPVTLYQFILYGAGDEVGGTLGVGNSGILTLITVCMVYLRIRQLQPKIGIKAYLNTIFLLPLFVNETKISFILIPIMFLCLSNIRKLSTIIYSVAGGLLLFFLLNNYYTNKGNTKENPFAEMFNVNFLEDYLLSEVKEEGYDVPRFTKIIIANSLLNRNTVDFLFGKEIGAFKGGVTISKSEFATQYNWLLLGSRPYIFFLLITGGWLLLSMMFCFFLFKFWGSKTKKWDAQFKLLLVVLFFIIAFYNDAFRSPFFSYMYVYFFMLAKSGQLETKSTMKRIKLNNRMHKVQSL